MSDFNTMYFAGLAGARGDHAEQNRQAAEKNFHAAQQWKNYAKELEHLLSDWKDRAVDEGARGVTKDQLLEREYGKTIYDLAGGPENYEELVEANKAMVRRNMNADG